MQVTRENQYFDIFPKVLPVGRPTVVTIRPLFDHVSPKADHTYSFEIVEMETYGKGAVPASGTWELTVTLPMEQEYRILLTDQSPDGKTSRWTFCVYAVEDDLLPLRPWKGDFHLHSCRSDGKESPLYVASKYREAGFDFFALTDHHQMPPSHEVMDGMSRLETDFKVYPGEEVHPPANEIHHVNFGGSFSVNDLHRQRETYEAEVTEIEKTVTQTYLTPDERRKFASSLWVFRKIREAGGISLFCHPYWIWNNRYNVSENLQRALFETLTFDAFELVSGFHPSESEQNALQLMRWAEERAAGKHIPVVGISDSHGVTNCNLFNWYYTIVLAENAEFASLADAIRNERSVAVNDIPNQSVHAFGPFRYVKYVHFLLREVLPLHHEECREEGRLMRLYFAGQTDLAPAIAACKGRVARLYAKLFSAR